MTPFTIESRHGPETISLAFEAGPERLVAVAEGNSTASAAVYGFNPRRDIFYRSPEPLHPQELAEEIKIHVPASFHPLSRRTLAGTAGTLVLLQQADVVTPAISPLAALGEILRATGDVNSAILHAEQGGVLFLHRAGSEVFAFASARSLKEILELPVDEREAIFPAIHANEIILSGHDLDHFERFDFGPTVEARTISMNDFLAVCEFNSAAAEHVELLPHRYTLAIGAAAVVHAVRSAV